jgi:hypothetical membrane protein
VIGREETIWIVGPLVIAYGAILIVRKTVRLEQIAIPAFIGIALDSILTLAGVFQFDNTFFLLPSWMIFLWIAFSSTLTSSLCLLGKRKIIASAVGCIGIPINYLAGEGLGAVTFGYSYLATTIGLCFLWAICLPLLYFSTQVQFTKIREFFKTRATDELGVKIQ